MLAADVSEGSLEVESPASSLPPLETALAELAGESNPFVRLAWLLQRYQALCAENGGLPQTLGEIAVRVAERGSWEVVLRDEYELHCWPRFPRNLLDELPAGYCSEIVQSLEERWQRLEKPDMLLRIEQWLGFRGNFGQSWFTEGCVDCLKRLQQARQAIGRAQSPNIYDLLGPVTEAYNHAGEHLISQLLSFYGRFLFGKDYSQAIYRRLTREAESKAVRAWQSSLPTLHQFVEALPGLSEQEQEERVRELVEYILRHRPGNVHEPGTARSLRTQEEEGRAPTLGMRVDLVMVLQRWLQDWSNIVPYGEQPESVWASWFEKVFGRPAIFEPPMNGDDKPSPRVRVVVKVGNVIASDERDATHEPKPIQQLRALNQIRPCYVHDQDSYFLRPENFDNVKRGGELIIDASIDLWQQLHRSVFPQVVIIKRLLQVNTDVIRIDYITEDSPEQLRCLRLPRSAVPDYLPDVLGEQVFFHCILKEQVVDRQAVIIPVWEGLVIEKGICR